MNYDIFGLGEVKCQHLCHHDEQERQSEEENAEIIVKIFVQFGHPNHAKVCNCHQGNELKLVLCHISERPRQSQWKIFRGKNCSGSNL